jgi:hypothetical protein
VIGTVGDSTTGGALDLQDVKIKALDKLIVPSAAARLDKAMTSYPLS